MNVHCSAVTVKVSGHVNQGDRCNHKTYLKSGAPLQYQRSMAISLETLEFPTQRTWLTVWHVILRDWDPLSHLSRLKINGWTLPYLMLRTAGCFRRRRCLIRHFLFFIRQHLTPKTQKTLHRHQKKTHPSPYGTNDEIEIARRGTRTSKRLASCHISSIVDVLEDIPLSLEIKSLTR